jgi:Na+/H+ antiporter NhaD/arsenite permease-like protein
MRMRRESRWHRLLERAEREFQDTHDERARQIRLLALRDTTLTVLAFVIVAEVLRQVWPANQTIKAVAYSGQFFVLAVAAVFAAVYYVSATVRGGDRTIQNSPREAITFMIGTLVFLGAVLVLVETGIFPRHSMWTRIVQNWGVILAAAAAMVLVRLVLWYRR